MNFEALLAELQNGVLTVTIDGRCAGAAPDFFPWWKERAFDDPPRES